MKTWNVGEKASVMVNGQRRAVEIVEVDSEAKKAKVRRANGEVSRVYLNALLQPGQTVHYRNPRVEYRDIALVLNDLSAQGYSLVKLLRNDDGEYRVLVQTSVPAQDAADVEV